jgi:energy-coupling factor transporter ATP-binding protein EcfA2
MRVFVGTQPLSASQLLLGREADLRRLRNLLLADRVVLLMGRSGSGKTSLIAALGGLLDLLQPEFRQTKRIDIGQCIDANQNDPGQELTRRIGPPPEPASSETKTLVVLDQLERCFQRPDAQQVAARLIAQLGRLIADLRDCTFLLVVQEEYLALLQALRQQIPGQLTIQYRLGNLDEVGLKRLIQVSLGGSRIATERFTDCLLRLFRQQQQTDQETLDLFWLQALGWLLEDVWPHSPSKQSSALAESAAEQQLQYELKERGLEACYLERCLRASPLGLRRRWHMHCMAALSRTFLNKSGGRRAEYGPPLKNHRSTGFLRFWARLRFQINLSFERTPNLDRAPAALWHTLKAWGVLRQVEATDVSRDPQQRLRWELAHDRLVPVLQQAQRAHQQLARAATSAVPLSLLVWLALLALLLLLPSDSAHLQQRGLVPPPQGIEILYPRTAPHSESLDQELSCLVQQRDYLDMYGICLDDLREIQRRHRLLKFQCTQQQDTTRKIIQSFNKTFKNVADKDKKEIERLERSNNELSIAVRDEQNARYEAQPKLNQYKATFERLCERFGRNPDFLKVIRQSPGGLSCTPSAAQR